MENWNWVVSADFSGKWVITHGYASLKISESSFYAELKYDESDIYHRIEGTIDSENGIKALVKSRESDIEPFEVFGQLFIGNIEEGVTLKTMVLTDGTTVIGLAHGPQSHKANL